MQVLRILPVSFLSAVAALATTGCMIRPLQPVNADGSYCYRFGRDPSPVLTCTPGPIPSASAEADAKRFVSAPGVLTVYVLRHRWTDHGGLVQVSIDGGPAAATVPASLVRYRVPAGAHRLTARWEAERAELDVHGKPGDIQFVELVGSSLAGRKSFSWQTVERRQAVPHAMESRLVADVDLRP